MSDQIRIKWVYPPNFTGTFPQKSNARGFNNYIVTCTNVSDGTGEVDEIKLKRTDLLTPDGDIPSKLVIKKIDYSIAGMTVRISYNNENDEEVAVLYNESGSSSFPGGFVPEDDDINEDGGDIVFNTSNETAGDSYTITLTVRPKT